MDRHERAMLAVASGTLNPQVERACAHFGIPLDLWDALPTSAQAALVICTPPEVPRSAVHLTLTAGAHTRAELLELVLELGDRLARGELTTGQRGSARGHYVYELVENERPTRSEYFDKVRAYLAETK